MGKKDIQQGEDENPGICRKCLLCLQCCQLPAATGVKIVSIISILIGLVFCCLGVWMIIVTTNNNELPLRNQVVYEMNQSPSTKSMHGKSGNGNGNGQPSLSVQNTVANAGEQETISTQSSLFDTSSVYLTAPSSSSLSSSSSSLQSSASLPGASGSVRESNSGTPGSSSSWPSSSVHAGKGPSGRRPPLMNDLHVGTKKILLSTYHNYLLCLGIGSICVGFIRTLASIFLLWNSVEKHSKTPGAVWITMHVLAVTSLLIFLGVTLNVSGFIYDFPWSPMTVQNDRFNFYLLLAMFRIVCVVDIFLTFYNTLVVLWFVRSLN